jgi:hypothetical protein
MVARAGTADPSRMGASRPFLAELHSLAGLIGGTIEYGEIIQRRARRRRMVEAEHRATQEPGLRGMVRFFLAER